MWDAEVLIYLFVIPNDPGIPSNPFHESSPLFRDKPEAQSRLRKSGSKRSCFSSSWRLSKKSKLVKFYCFLYHTVVFRVKSVFDEKSAFFELIAPSVRTLEIFDKQKFSMSCFRARARFIPLAVAISTSNDCILWMNAWYSLSRTCKETVCK